MQLQSLQQLYEINSDFVPRLQKLSEYEIILILDDSGSMNNPASKLTPYFTRWQELQKITNVIVDIASIFNPNGINVHFLNRYSVYEVKDFSQLYSSFQTLPFGYTPITQATSIAMEIESDIMEIVSNQRKKRIFILITDGLPTDSRGNDDVDNFKNRLKHKSKDDYVMIVACTDDDAVIEYLNKLDRELENIDVCDDYESERKEIFKTQGPPKIGMKFQLSRGRREISTLSIFLRTRI